MSADQLLFRFDGVGVVRDEAVLLADIEAEVPDHGVTALVGPSGAGKSTLLRLCNRLDVATTGRVLYRGQDLDDLDPLVLRRQVGMVFQQPSLFGGTVDDNLAVAVPDSSRDARRRALRLAALDPDVLARRADTLSGGEAQRTCLARTLLTEPGALLLDEPTAALDSDAKLAFEDTARDLADRGIPIVWVTHERDQVRRVADRVLVLEAGRLVAALDDPGQLDDRLRDTRTDPSDHGHHAVRAEHGDA